MGRPLIIPSQRTDWCTPEEVCNLVYLFFGGHPALDPCGAPGQVLKAQHILFAPVDDGLRYPWRGNVYCNPPYGRGIEDWIEKAATSPQADTLLLVPAAVSSHYWHDLVFPLATGICFLRGRVRFVGGQASAGFPSAVLYYGSPTGGRFLQVFSRAGYVVNRMEDAR